MILAPAASEAPVPRLLEALVSRGYRVDRGGGAATREGEPVVVLCTGGTSPAALDALLARARGMAQARVLVLSRLGAHPDARAAGLAALWALEERARACGLPALTLRLGPLLGPRSPLWLRLRACPKLPRAGRQLLNPVAEADAVETIARALDGRAEWRGWYEVAGPEVWSLAELAALARESGPALPRGAGAWEPPLEELAEHRLVEAGPWLAHFGLAARPLADLATEPVA
ncbi:MAG: hypothetical protein HZC42_12355 [Candidatus Eisenbacteria bacterium]|nr:hypothetical protein [Candidatus Eisenbacteria bacterium]